MKTPLLLRHAKSDWDNTGLPDFERPLSPRGRRDAPTIGKALKKREPLPDLNHCLPSRSGQRDARGGYRGSQT